MTSYDAHKYPRPRALLDFRPGHPSYHVVLHCCGRGALLLAGPYKNPSYSFTPPFPALLSLKILISISQAAFAVTVPTYISTETPYVHRCFRIPSRHLCLAGLTLDRIAKAGLLANIGTNGAKPGYGPY